MPGSVLQVVSVPAPPYSSKFPPMLTAVLDALKRPPRSHDFDYDALAAYDRETHTAAEAADNFGPVGRPIGG